MIRIIIQGLLPVLLWDPFLIQRLLRPGDTVALVDAGMNDLIRPALYDAYHRIENICSNKEDEVYDVVGPVCESSDVFCHDRKMPATERGDLLAIRSAGAYGEAMSFGYNCRALPKAVLSTDVE